MDNKIIGLFAIVLIGVFVFAGVVVVQNSKNLGVALTASDSAVSQQGLFDALKGIRDDLASNRAPLSGLAVAASSVSWGSLVDGAVSSTVINVPGGGTIGDLVLVQPATAASSTVGFRAEITTTGSTNASATIYAVNLSSTTIAVGTLTTRVWVFPVSTFKAPSALTTSY